jgi:hypothetical protein
MQENSKSFGGKVNRNAMEEQEKLFQQNPPDTKRRFDLLPTFSKAGLFFAKKLENV